jgi:hypothetical protein
MGNLEPMFKKAALSGRLSERERYAGGSPLRFGPKALPKRRWRLSGRGRARKPLRRRKAPRKPRSAAAQRGSDEAPCGKAAREMDARAAQNFQSGTRKLD